MDRALNCVGAGAAEPVNCGRISSSAPLSVRPQLLYFQSCADNPRNGPILLHIPGDALARLRPTSRKNPRLRTRGRRRVIRRVRTHSKPQPFPIILANKQTSQIIDDNYLHALRIYQDTITGAVRLQASVHKGEMDRSPVWTAFITDHIKEHIMTRAWIRRSSSDPKAVILRELHPSVFAFMDYNPQVTARGEHVLRFLTRDGEFPP